MLLAGPITHTSTQYMDFVKIFSISMDFSAIYFAHLVSVKLPLCIVVIRFQNAMTRFLESSCSYFKSLNFFNTHSGAFAVLK